MILREIMKLVKKTIAFTNKMQFPTFNGAPPQLLVKSEQAALGTFLRILRHSAWNQWKQLCDGIMNFKLLSA